MALGRTSWDVLPRVRADADNVARRFGSRWNTYAGHGSPSGHASTQVTDHWNPGGRGDPLDEGRGDAICSWVLGQREFTGVVMVIWWSWWWRPGYGWLPYNGFHGNHGPGSDAHVHVVYG